MVLYVTCEASHYNIRKERGVFMPIKGKIVGDIHINVCKTSEGSTFFYLQADNKKVLPVLDFIEDHLNIFKD